MKISVIIPTLNEEKYLPKLLGCLKRQTLQPYEVIVADANSKDNTREVGRKFGAKIVDGGAPAVGRNNGAKKATGDFLFFFDSDIQIQKDFIKKAVQELEKRFLDIATCEAIPISKNKIDKVLFDTTNMLIKLNQYSNPHAGGYCILVTKRLFDRVGGFDETIKLAEDYEFVKRAARFRKLRVLNSVKTRVSVRRLEKEGRLTLVSKFLHSELYRFFIGEIKKDIVKYEFGNYGSKKKVESKLIHMKKELLQYKKRYNGKKG